MKLLLTALSALGLVAAQDLASALRAYPEASQFSSNIADIAPDLNTANGRQYTILIPSNTAFNAYSQAKGGNISALSQDQRRNVLRYHVLVGALTSTNFSAAAGITVPTLLRDQQFNNRSAGAAITSKFGAGSDGQVLYISKDLNAVSAGGSSKFRIRQTQQGGLAVRSGLDNNSTLTAVDGTWSGGRFQIVNTVLEPPAPCSRTIRSIAELASYDAALNRTSFWPQVDRTPNVTCLAPNNLALSRGGNPQQSLSQSDLRAAIELHTLSGPLYSDLMTDGQTLKSFNGLTVKVAVNSSGTYFNDAKVVQQNVLTNNGLVHVLDKFMSPIAGEKLPTGNSTSSGGSSSGSGSGSSGGSKTSNSTLSFSMTDKQMILVVILSLVVVFW